MHKHLYLSSYYKHVRHNIFIITLCVLEKHEYLMHNYLKLITHFLYQINFLHVISVFTIQFRRLILLCNHLW